MEQSLQYLSVAVVAEQTGLSEAFWRKAILHRRIAYVKLGRRVMIRRGDLDAWVAARVVRAESLCQRSSESTEIASEAR
jgi:excisionase family DNA binding protein